MHECMELPTLDPKFLLNLPNKRAVWGWRPTYMLDGSDIDRQTQVSHPSS